MLHISKRNMHYQGLGCGGKLLCNEVLGGYLMSEKENFSFSSRKLWTLDFSFSSQNRGTGFNISLSLLENGDIVFTFSFSSRSLSIENPFLFLLSKVEHILLEFSFPSRNWRKEFPVSLSSLETGEKESLISLSLLDWTFWPLVNDWDTWKYNFCYPWNTSY